MKIINRIYHFIDNLFLEDENEINYNPVHFAGMIVLTLFGITIFFWLFWSLLVYENGIFQKIIPFLQLIFSNKKLKDFGYYGWFDAGIFEGWITNLSALLLFFILLFFIYKFFRKVK